MGRFAWCKIRPTVLEQPKRPSERSSEGRYGACGDKVRTLPPIRAGSPCAEQDVRVGRGGAVEQVSAVAEMQVVERQGVCALDGCRAVRCYRADLFLDFLLGHVEQAGQAPVKNLEVAVGIVSR